MHATQGTDTTLTVSIGQCSERGHKQINQDALAVRVPADDLLRTKGVVAALADGLSSAAAGREAAESCVLGFISDYYATPSLWSVARSAQRVLEALNRWLCRQTLAGDSHLCTLSIIILRSRTAHLLQIGDSRIWRLRDQTLECLTRDHSRITAGVDPLAVGGRQKVLTRAMGGDTRLEVDYRQCDLQVGDQFLLTSDGIHDVVPVSTMEHIILAATSPESAAQALVDEALKRRSQDNLSCQLLTVTQVPNATAGDALTASQDLPLPPPLSPGMHIDGMTIVREMHASARSHLYLIRDADGTLGALKTPSINLVDDRPALERFVLEGWIAARLRHAHLMRPQQTATPPGCLYQRLEYIDGVTLRQWLKEHPDAAVEEHLYLADQLLNGLRALHRADVIHGDLKPDNIMIDHTGVLKIIDFGSCYCRGLSTAPPDMPLGAKEYTAPEVLTGDAPGEQSDLFSVAVIIHEMLTGELPRPSRPGASQWRPATPLQQTNAFIPAWVEQFLQRGLHPQKERRFSDAAEFREALRRPGNNAQRILADNTRHLRFWQATCLLLAVLLLLSIAIH